MFSAVLSFSQVEQEAEKEERNAPATNNVLREEVTQEDAETLNKAKKSLSQKQQKIKSVSASISATLSQASRMNSQRSYTIAQKEQLSAGVSQLKSLDKNSFDYHLYNYLQKPYNFDQLESLKKAESINAYDFTVLKSFSAYHQIMGNENELKQYLSKLHSGKYFNEELSKYAKLTLTSLPDNAVLITHGNDDTYPLLIQQKINNIRNDVEIISLDHLVSEVYREKLKNRGYKIPNRSIVDTKFLKSFVALNKGKKVTCANSLPQPYLNTLSGELNVVGYSFSTYSMNTVNVAFYESNLKVELRSLLNSNSRTILRNSLPLLFDVRNHYIEKKQENKRQEVENWIRLIGDQLNISTQINALLK